MYYGSMGQMTISRQPFMLGLAQSLNNLAIYREHLHENNNQVLKQ